MRTRCDEEEGQRDKVMDALKAAQSEAGEESTSFGGAAQTLS